ncbi:hypothetical protein [Pseudomonas sp. SK]|uniref:hypothetical protein n=1 Tax=Pseudomonas sp. SK TaxID=2729423 RepID=UPI002114C7AB|nr:hypothetical protein [Pseudomonas sp. SK]
MPLAPGVVDIEIRALKDNINLLAKLDITAHAAQFAQIGAASEAGTFPEPPKPGKGDLELLYQYANSNGVKTGDYDVIDALGNMSTTCSTTVSRPFAPTATR